MLIYASSQSIYGFHLLFPMFDNLYFRGARDTKHWRLGELVQLGNRFAWFVRTCDAKLHVPLGRFQGWAAEAPEVLRRVAWRGVPRALRPSVGYTLVRVKSIIDQARSC